MTYQKQPNASAASAASATEILEVPYRPSTAGLPVEALKLSDLLRRQLRTELTKLQRVQFELLVYSDTAAGRHEVDFSNVELAPDRILHVRPGQVHRWIFEPPYEAQLILLQPLDNRRSWKPGSHIIEADRELRHDLSDIIGVLSRPDRRSPLSMLSLEAIRDLVVARLGLDDSYQQDTTQHDGIYNDFERLLAQADPPPRTVDSCARSIGCSTRTLTRSCQAAAGVTPKHLIDRAVALEAQRHLGLGGSSATKVSEILGFAEPSHFSRFFLRVTGETPSAFAAAGRVRRTRRPR